MCARQALQQLKSNQRRLVDHNHPSRFVMLSQEAGLQHWLATNAAAAGADPWVCLDQVKQVPAAGSDVARQSLLWVLRSEILDIYGDGALQQHQKPGELSMLFQMERTALISWHRWHAAGHCSSCCLCCPAAGACACHTLPRAAFAVIVLLCITSGIRSHPGSWLYAMCTQRHGWLSSPVGLWQGGCQRSVWLTSVRCMRSCAPSASTHLHASTSGSA